MPSKDYFNKKVESMKRFLSEKTRNVLQTDKIVIRFSINFVGWLIQLDEDRIYQSRLIDSMICIYFLGV